MDVFEKRLFRKVAFGKHLAQARTRLQLSQEALAEAVGTTARSISRWEHDQAIPQQYYRERLCEVLQSTPEALFGANEEEQQVVVQPTFLWHMPYARNPYFTGRETTLHQLHKRLQVEYRDASAQPQVLTGLGGIGKTQTALEYAYRFRNDYQAVLWIGAETPESLMSDYLALAQLFQLPEKDSSDYSTVRTAVKRWFQNHSGWLLIFDNVEDLKLLNTMLPDTRQGHVLITTRSQIVGTLGFPIDLQKMGLAEGAQFLLQRARLLPPETPSEEAPATLLAPAETLVQLLDGLPLALDQAGAYIEETACSLPDYLERYTMRRSALLNSRGTADSYHPASVTATLSLSFQQVEQASPLAANLLRFCAFLHAETIPEEFLTQNGEVFGPLLQAFSANPLLLDEAIRNLRRFSLLHRESETRILSMHRLLQIIIQDEMKEDERREWIECIIRGMLHIFPEYSNATTYDNRMRLRCQQYFPHALVCAAHIKEWNIISPDAEEFLYRLAHYLLLWGDHSRAMLLMLQASYLAKDVFGMNHTRYVAYLQELAFLHMDVKQYTQSEHLFRLSLSIYEELSEPNHPGVADGLWGLANLLYLQGKYSQAEIFAQQALAIKEHVLGPSHYEVAMVLTVLGAISMFQNKYAQAEQLLQKAIQMYEKGIGADHIFSATCLKHLGTLSSLQKDYPKATAYYQQALQIYEKRVGFYHPRLAPVVNSLGDTCYHQKQYQQAKSFYHKGVMLYKKFPEFCHFEGVYSIINVGEFYIAQNRLRFAKCYIDRAFVLLGKIRQVDQVDHQAIIDCLLLAGDQLTIQGEGMQAQIFYQRALVISKQALKTWSPSDPEQP